VTAGRKKTVIGDPILRITWSPLDSTKFVAEQLVNGVSKLFVHSTVDTMVTSLTSNTAREESPFWADDGRIYFSADYDGINNIYGINSDGSDLKRYTTTNTGCFSPVAVDKSVVVYSGYSASGFTIVKCENRGVAYEITSGADYSFKALPAPKGKVTINATPYRAHYGRKLSELSIFGSILRNDGFILKDDKVDIDTTAYNAGVSLALFKQDPLQKKNRLMGLAVGFAGENYGESESKKRSFKSSLQTVDNNFLHQEALMKMPEVKGEILSSKIIKNSDFSTRLNQVFESKATNADSSDTNTPNFQIYLQPMLSLVNKESAATLQLQVAAITPIIPIPILIETSLLCEFQLSKNSRLAIGAVPSIIPLLPWIYGQIPLVFNWSTLGIYNEDVNYNFNNYSQVTISTGAEFIPVQKIENENTDYADTSLLNANALYASALVFHAFPLGKYVALQPELQGSYYLFDREMRLNDFDDKSATLLQTLAGVKFVFPIVRNINTGNTYYFDNFYGSVGYSLLLEMSGVFLENPSKNILHDKNYSKNAAAGHLISATFELGHYKSSMFFKKFVIGADYELLREKVYLKVASEF